MSSENLAVETQQKKRDTTVAAEIMARPTEKAAQPTEIVLVSKKKSSKHNGLKPARVQVDPCAVDENDRPPQTGTVFNIWYQKWSGGDKDDAYFSQRKADGRCNIERDSGYTKADIVPGSFFCLYFARGLCTKGKKCEYLHRLPTVTDIFSPNLDCFGRDRFSDYRDDMGGVGSFLRQNRTLYIGRVNIRDDMEEIVYRHFSEWGEIDRIRVLNKRGVAFVTYLNECNAQFAKEAMAHQSLDDEEVLNVRWATEDPNPMSQMREKRRLEEQAAEAIRKILPAQLVAEIEGKDNGDARRKRTKDSSFELEGYEAPPDLWYAPGDNSVNKALRGGEIEKERADNVVTENANSETSGRALLEDTKPSTLLSDSMLDQLKSLKNGIKKINDPSRLSALVDGYNSD